METTTNYEIVTIDDLGNYSADGVGEPNRFESIAEAEEAIQSLRELGDEWRVPTFAIRAIGERYSELGTRDYKAYSEAVAPA